MNNRVEIPALEVPFTDGTSSKTELVVADVNIAPFYASIRDIEISMPLGAMKFNDEISGRLVEIIFNKSVWIDNFMRRLRLGLTPEEIFMIKRDFVICAVLSQLGKILYAELLKGSSVKKVLGDFEVDRTLSYDTDGAKNMANDAKKCTDDILASINSMASVLAVGTAVRNGNRCTIIDRQWHHPPYLSKTAIAANKLLEMDGRFYKTGYGHGNEQYALYTRG